MNTHIQNDNLELETFFTLLNPEENIEHLTLAEDSIQKISIIDDINVNMNINNLETTQKQIISKNNSIDELTNNTSLLYNYIYTIFITILVIIVLGIITYLKSILNINENMYMTLIILTLLSYIFYILYLYNIMYVKDSINKIINFIRTGRFEIGKIKFGKVPQSVYIQQLCKKKEALIQLYEEEDNNIHSKLINGKELIKTLPENNGYYYNDNNAPKQQMLPLVTSSTFSIYNVDADNNSKAIVKTTHL